MRIDDALADLFQTAFTQAGRVGSTDAIVCRRMKHNGTHIYFSANELAALARFVGAYERFEHDDSKTVRRVVDRIKEARRKLIFERAAEQQKKDAEL